MSPLHLECYPDETVARCAGKTVKSITHHTGKSRVMNELSKKSGLVAMVDEDPASAKHPHEHKLKLRTEAHGIKVWSDSNSNKVVMVCPRLEEWLLTVCIQTNIDPTDYGLPADAKELHKVIHHRLQKVKLLVEHLKVSGSAAISFLENEIR